MITDFQKTKIFINEGYEKLLINYKDIESFLLNLSLSIPSDYKGQILKIKDDLLSMKDNFKLFISSLNEHISSLAISHDSSTNNSDISKSLTITPRMKSSYDMISNEFDKLEKITTDIIKCNQNSKEKREKRRGKGNPERVSVGLRQRSQNDRRKGRSGKRSRRPFGRWKIHRERFHQPSFQDPRPYSDEKRRGD